eukprot:6775750-Pyramimonas_sp.AAC.1
MDVQRCVSEVSTQPPTPPRRHRSHARRGSCWSATPGRSRRTGRARSSATPRAASTATTLAEGGS